MRERLIARSDREYALLEAESPDSNAPRLLALHGFLDHGGSFGPLTEALPGAGWAALDFPGHGASPHHQLGHEYPFMDFTWDVVNVLDALSWDRATLVGHSMGGGVATLVAAACPDRVEKLVLIDSPGPFTKSPEATVKQLGSALRRIQSRRGDRRRVFESVERAREALMRQAPFSDAAADVLLSRSLEAVAGGWRWRADPRLRTPSLSQLTPAQVENVLDALRCPVLLLVGAESHILKAAPELFELVVKRVASVTRRDLPGGHHLHIDAPDAVARAIAEFLDS